MGHSTIGGNTTHNGRRAKVVILSAVIAVLAVVAVLVAQQYLFPPKVTALAARQVAAGQTADQPLATNGGDSVLVVGTALMVTGKTSRTETATLVLANADTGAKLATAPEVKVGPGGILKQTLDQTRTLGPGEYVVNVYLDDSDTVDGSIRFTIA